MQNNCTPNLKICQLIIEKIRELLNSKKFLDAHRLPNRFVRTRKLSMLNVILYLFYSSKQAMHLNIHGIRIDLPEINFPKVCKQAVSKARQGILPSLFETLFNVSIDCFYKNIGELKLWRNQYRIFAIDGSKLSLPNSKSNFDNYGEMFSHQNPSRRWTMALCSTIYDVCNDYIVHGLLRRYLGSERSAVLDHCDVLNSLKIFDNALLILDRGYYSENMFRYFVKNDRLCLMRLKENYKLAKNCDGDTVQTLKGDSKNGTEDIPIRVIRVPLDGGSFEYLATNIYDTLTADDFKELYFLRWPIEQKYEELKNKCLLEEFHGATSTSVEQEFYLTLLLSNLASLIKADADTEISKAASPGNKYRYQANRAFIIGSIKKILPKILTGLDSFSLMVETYEQACTIKSQIQPGRKCPRNHRAKYRERKHFNNRKRVI